MFVLDTDTLTLLFHAHRRMTERLEQATEEVVITVISRIEILEGRFASVFKAETGDKLIVAQQRLVGTEEDLNRFTILAIENGAAAEFDHLRQNKKLKKIGRGDLLIAAITLREQRMLIAGTG